MWILVRKINNQPQRYLVVFNMVEKPTTGCCITRSRHWITSCVNHESWLMSFFRYLPHFLQANTVMLWVTLLIQFELTDDFLAKVTAATFSQNRVFSMELETGFERRLFLSLCIDTHVTGSYSFDAAILVIEDFCGCESRKYFCSQFHSLFC